MLIFSTGKFYLIKMRPVRDADKPPTGGRHVHSQQTSIEKRRCLSIRESLSGFQKGSNGGLLSYPLALCLTFIYS
jgi:hypothetical protein